MTELLTRLDLVADRLRDLQQERESLRTENEELKSRIGRLQHELDEQKELIINLEEKNKIAKLADGVSSDQGRSDLKDQLDQLIAEIDQAIALVKKQ